MKLFGIQKTKNWIIKLFKVTDTKTAEEFNMKECILSVIDSLSKATNITANHFELNYRDSRRTLKGFKKILKDQEEIVYSFVGFDTEKTNNYFTISNPMLNWIERPENSTIDICVQLSERHAELNYVEQIADKLTKQYEFDYGYITNLPSNYDSETERKIKKGIFSNALEINEIDHVWTFHSVGILEGFIKSIYSVNYLNNSHFIDIAFKELISSFGKLEKIENSNYKWKLNMEELNELRKNDQINRKSIVTANLDFLKTKQAKLFNDRMKTKASC